MLYLVYIIFLFWSISPFLFGLFHLFCLVYFAFSLWSISSFLFGLFCLLCLVCSSFLTVWLFGLLWLLFRFQILTDCYDVCKQQRILILGFVCVWESEWMSEWVRHQSHNLSFPIIKEWIGLLTEGRLSRLAARTCTQDFRRTSGKKYTLDSQDPLSLILHLDWNLFLGSVETLLSCDLVMWPGGLANGDTLKPLVNSACQFVHWDPE